MGGGKMPEGIKEISFSFCGDQLSLTYLQEGEKKEIRASLGGSYAENTVGSGVVSRALVSAAFVKENVLRVSLRWIETTSERKFDFVFEDDSLKVEYEHPFRFFMKEAPVPILGTKIG